MAFTPKSIAPYAPKKNKLASSLLIHDLDGWQSRRFYQAGESAKTIYVRPGQPIDVGSIAMLIQNVYLTSFFFADRAHRNGVQPRPGHRVCDAMGRGAHRIGRQGADRARKRGASDAREPHDVGRGRPGDALVWR